MIGKDEKDFSKFASQVLGESLDDDLHYVWDFMEERIG